MKVAQHILFLLLIILGSVPYASAKNKVIIEEKTNRFFIHGDFLSYWESDSHPCKIPESYESLSRKLKPLRMVQANFGFTPNDIWFEFEISSKTKSIKNLFLKINNPNLDRIDLYRIKNNQLKFICRTGDLQDFATRPVKNRLLIIPLKIKPNDSTKYLLRVNNGTEHFNFNLELLDKNAFFDEIYQQQYFLGAFFGVLLFIFLFNFSVGLIVKEKVSFYYCLYISSFVVLQLSNLGFAKEYLWPNNSYLSNHINPITATLSIFFLLKFCYHYLQIPILLPKLKNLFRFLAYPLLLNLLFSIIPLEWSYTFSIVFINAITLFLNILVIGISLFAIYKKYKPAKIFFLAFSILFISVFAFILKNFGLLPSNTFTNYGLQFGSIIEAVLLTFGIIIRFKIVLEQSYNQVVELNKLKDDINTNLESQVAIRTQEIKEQKEVIEEKNKEIISSISYAKRIQEAILPTETILEQILKKWALYYEPKDIIAGDFYWVSNRLFNNEEWIYFAVADCTGHGVPGAMMSVLCNTALNSSLVEIKSPGTSELLEKTSIHITQNLSASTTDVKDGMDISLCCYHPQSKTLYWSGANSPLFLIRNNEIKEYTPTKKPIGISGSKEPFAQHMIQLLKGDVLLMYTDGLVDQFGGPSNKKFKKSRLREVILTTSDQNIKNKMKSIQSAFTKWKDGEEQIDDVCVLLFECI